jgi:hypothetical protein
VCEYVGRFTFNRGFKRFQQNIHKSSPNFHKIHGNGRLSADENFLSNLCHLVRSVRQKGRGGFVELCYRHGTVMLRWCYNGVILVLQSCCGGVTVVLHLIRQWSSMPFVCACARARTSVSVCETGTLAPARESSEAKARLFSKRGGGAFSVSATEIGVAKSQCCLDEVLIV